MPHEDLLEPYFPTNKQKRAVVLGPFEGKFVQRLAPLFDRIVAIEPSPDSFAKLEALKLPNVIISQSAAWIACGEQLDFHVRADNQRASALACRDTLRETGVTETIKATSISVDGLNLEACDLILCDVEGAELQAMMGATATIEEFKPDLLISCHEIEHRQWLSTWLERCGYNVAIVHDPDREVGDDWQRNVYLIAQHYRFRGAL